MNRHGPLFAALVCLVLAGAGCSTLLGDFAGQTSSDNVDQDATLRSDADSTHDGSLTDDGETSRQSNGSIDASADAAFFSEAGGGDEEGGPGQTVTCVPGGACAPSDCQEGAWTCTDGGRACQATTAVDSGTPCGVGGDAGSSVCNAGQCVACNAGGDCSDPNANCIEKSYDCSSGAAVCRVGGNVPDGVSCDAGLYCNAGACAPCQVGTACPPATNGCHVGKVTACLGGIATCTDQATPAPTGTPCSTDGGANGVCNGTGSCAACSPNAQCMPNGNPCQVGVQSCSGAAPLCTNPVAVHEGETCGTSLICDNGTCVGCNGPSCPEGCCDSHGCVTTAQTISECGDGTGGAACAACPGPSTGASSGSPVCSGNACAISCSGTTSACRGACVNLDSDDNNCGTCGHGCGQGYHCDGHGACACTATTTCSSLGDNCGSFVDECKVTQSCGSCTPLDVCATAPNGAGTCSCKATDTCSSHGYACGSFKDSCGNTPNCGSCASPKICSGASGAGGTCSCTAKMTCSSLHATCGSFVDDCGATQNCGTCASGSGTCSGSPGTCGGCNKSACGSNVCGSASEGTNCPAASCGTCTAPMTCSSTTGAGTCVCPSGTANCSGTCADIATDSKNCGSCGNTCASGLRCSGGSCVCDVTSCPSGCCVGNSTCAAKPVWYLDGDGDGYGGANETPVPACTKPPPFGTTQYVSNNGDCCDSDSTANPGYVGGFQVTPDGCGDFLYSCETNGVPVAKYTLPVCSGAWQTCLSAAQSTGSAACATGGCSSVCSASTTTCNDYGVVTPACGSAILEDQYSCQQTGASCTPSESNHIFDVQGCK